MHIKNGPSLRIFVHLINQSAPDDEKEQSEKKEEKTRLAWHRRRWRQLKMNSIRTINLMIVSKQKKYSKFLESNNKFFHRSFDISINCPWK